MTPRSSGGDRRRFSRRSLVRLLMAAVLLLPALAGCQAAVGPGVPNTLTIGVIAPFSGDFEPLGRAVRDGVSLAAELWNQEQGVLGRTVQLALEDSRCDYQEARAATQRLIEEQDVQFIIGAVCADASEGVAQIASDAGALQISPASVDLDFTLDVEGALRPLVFRIPVTDPHQGVVAATFALENLEAEDAAVLYAEESVYGRALVEAFTTTFEEGGGDVVARQDYDPEAELFFEELEEIREADVDVIYAPGYHTVMNRLLAQARQFGLLEPVIGSDGWHAPSLDLNVADDIYFTTHYFADATRLEAEAWRETFESRYLVPPNTLAALSYEAADVLFTAIEETELFDPLLVAETMESLTFETVTGRIRFDAAHNPVKAVPILAVSEGRTRLETKIMIDPPADEPAAEAGEDGEIGEP